MLAARPADPSREPRQRPRPLRRQDGTDDLAVFRGLAETCEVVNSKREERYLLARRQLRLWPISHTSDLVAAVSSFLSERLLISEQHLASLSFTVEPLLSRPESPEQVLVTFHTVRQRDEVRAKAANLRGADRGVGCQLEPPDHLRTQYQAFQNLAFCLKKKNPDLKQNIKFDDRQQCLIMDVKTLDGWKTIEYEAARETLRGRTRRSGSISGRELKSILNTSDVVDSDTSMNEVDDTVVENTTENDNISNNLSLRTIAFLNTNARSLGPKITSLADCFEEKRLDLATVTETWFQSDRLRQELEQEMTDKHALCMISRERSRAAANGRQYGGVAMVFRRRTCKFDVFPLVNDDDHEVLAAVGKITGIKGKVFCLSCYAPPNLTVTQARSMIEYVSDVIGEAKRSFAECTIIVNGDFNQWPFEELLDDHPDMRELDHGPTRDDRKIDRSFTNFHRSIKESCTLSPLETEAGAVSDHKMVFALAEFPSVAKEMITYTYRKFTEQGADNFVRECRLQTWDTVVGALTVDGKVEAFDKIMNENMDKFFPFVTVTRKASDPPWMNDNIRRLQRKRRKIYDRHGRSRRWRRLKKLCDDLYRARAEKYVKKQKMLLTGPNAAKSFYKHVKAYSSREKPPDFDPCDLFPGDSQGEVAEKLAEHYNKISAEFDGIQPHQIPTARSQPLPVLTTADVKEKLVEAKKKSMVDGDLIPQLVNRSADYIACPLASIYNAITQQERWPVQWKVESVTPIPKKSLPQSPNDTRNISCTRLFSKVYESFVLSWLSRNCKLRPNQYGGVKGSGTEHFLVQLWQDVLEGLDDSRAGVLLSSIDYSKAFNRLDFARCLTALKAKGVGQELINIIASFLSGRQMSVKVGNCRSELRPVQGGVPQGSRLGVFLFNCTIDNFEAFSEDVATYGPLPNEILSETELDAIPPDLPIPTYDNSRNYKHLPPFGELPLYVQKYVDDNIIMERINFDQIPTDGYTFRIFEAIRTQNLFRQIVARALACGMQVNASKTQCMLISEVKSYISGAYFHDSTGVKIKNENNMKVLGFQLSSAPDMSAQVAEIKRKYRLRLWILRHLAHCGLTKPDLLRVYQSVILPCHDYCSVVYHSSLTTLQSDQLERLQSQALKSIYGYEHSYRSLLQLTGLKSLRDRREARCNKFAVKAASNPRYAHWFPRAEQRRALRNRPLFAESRAKTKRLFNSPLYDLRRRLNLLNQ